MLRIKKNIEATKKIVKFFQKKKFDLPCDAATFKMRSKAGSLLYAMENQARQERTDVTLFHNAGYCAVYNTYVYNITK